MSRISLLVDKILSDFLHQADIKSLNSAKSLNNPIPVHVHVYLVVKGTRCLGLVELVFKKRM